MEKVDILSLARACPGVIISVKAEDLVAANAKLVEEAKVEAERKAAQREGAHLMTVEEVVKTLNVSTTTLWRWQKSGYLVPLNVGGQRRYKSADVEAIMEGKV